MRLNRIRSASLLALLGAALSCRAPRPAATFAPGPAGGEPRHGGHVLFVREEDPDFLDPALSYGAYTAPLIYAVFHTLLDYVGVPGPAGAGLVPDLAESMPAVCEGGTLFCFKVRTAARFDEPVRRHITAEDFKYSIERLFRVGSPGANFYRDIVGADEVLAGRDSILPGVIARGDSLYIRLTRPDPIFLMVFSMSFTAPVPREIAERYPTSFSQHTVSTGPFRVAEYTPRRRVLLVRNPYYCGAPAWLDTFELRLGVSPTNAVAMIRRGLADGGIFEVPASEYARLRSDSLWRHQLDVADGLNTYYLFLNVTQKPFSDPRVRQAIAWAIDRRAIVKCWSGKAEVAGEFLPPGMPGAVRLERYQGPDVGRAKRLLREAGYPNGFETTLYGWTTEPGPRELALVQEQLSLVGIRARLDLGEATGYTSLAGDTANHIPFGIYGWFADYPDPSNFFDPLLNGKRIIPIHNNNLGLYNDPVLNQLIERAMRTADDSTRIEMWRRADRMVMDAAGVVPMIHALDSRLYHPRVGGWYRHITRILRIQDLYIKAEPSAPVARREGGAR
jgi:ABC-type transport system substrate-binding protein